MLNPLLVSIKCPECGGPLRYPEGTYTFKCPFCDSAIRIKTEGTTLKYIISSPLKDNEIILTIKKIIGSKKGILRQFREIREIRTIYKPFWYFKGMIYSCCSRGGTNETKSKTWYYTFPANLSFVNSFQSLGIRSEVLSIESYDSEGLKDSEIILPITVNKDQAIERAEYLAGRGIDRLSLHYSFFKTSIIGEKYFIIYYPIIEAVCFRGDYCHTFLLDGLNKTLYEEDDNKITPVNKEKIEPYNVKFSSHRCKNCGYDLESGDFDIIFYCKNCFRLWLLKGIDYYSQKIRILETEERKNIIYIPFWRFEPTISSKSTGLNIKTIGDLSEFMKMGQYLLRREDPKRPLRFYVPAIVTRNANALIKLAARIGTFQKGLPLSKREDLPFEKIWNVSLPEEEAEEMLEPLIFMVIGRNDRSAINFYNDCKITVKDKQLVYYPFEDKGNALADQFHNYHLPKRSFDLNVY